MSRTERKPTPTALVYGVVLIPAVAAALIGVMHLSSEEPELAPPLAGAEEHAAEEAGNDAPLVVPDLPAVPDLARDGRLHRAREQSADSSGGGSNESDSSGRASSESGVSDNSGLTIEMRTLSRAHELLAEHPGTALSVLEQHRSDFPNGYLAEEREAATIEALTRLERHDEAERRFYDFIARWPDSDSQERLSELMRRH